MFSKGFCSKTCINLYVLYLSIICNVLRFVNYIINLYDDADDDNECIVFLNCSVSDAIHRRKIKFLTKLQY